MLLTLYVQRYAQLSDHSLRTVEFVKYSRLRLDVGDICSLLKLYDGQDLVIFDSLHGREWRNVVAGDLFSGVVQNFSIKVRPYIYSFYVFPEQAFDPNSYVVPWSLNAVVLVEAKLASSIFAPP